MLLLVVYRDLIFSDPVTAEAMGAWHSADLCNRLGTAKVMVESDSLEVVQVLRKEGNCGSSYGALLNDAKELFRSCQQWDINHV